MGIKRRRTYGAIILILLLHTVSSFSSGDVIINQTNTTLLNEPLRISDFFIKHEKDVLKYYKDNQITYGSLIINGLFASFGIFLLNILFLIRERRLGKKSEKNKKKSQWYKVLIIDEHLDNIHDYFELLKKYTQMKKYSHNIYKNHMKGGLLNMQNLFSDLMIFDISLSKEIQDILLDIDDSVRSFTKNKISKIECLREIRKAEIIIKKYLYNFDFEWEKKKKKN